MNKAKVICKKVTSYHLFLTLLCLALVLLANIIKTPDFFHVTMSNGVLYGRIIDVLNRGSELDILAVGMTLVVAASEVQIFLLVQ